jgi:hypothetical protein
MSLADSLAEGAFDVDKTLNILKMVQSITERLFYFLNLRKNNPKSLLLRKYDQRSDNVNRTTAKMGVENK